MTMFPRIPVTTHLFLLSPHTLWMISSITLASTVIYLTLVCKFTSPAQMHIVTYIASNPQLLTGHLHSNASQGLQTHSVHKRINPTNALTICKPPQTCPSFCAPHFSECHICTNIYPGA